jgi:drug/metabolite transporter (DMT)-like permease
MSQRLTPSTALLLTIPPLLWAGNAIVGRMVRDAVPPMTLNLLRWSIALLILLVLGRSALRQGSGLLVHWRRFALLGLFGIGIYNSLQYLALQSSTPINVTLVASGMPVWMLLVGSIGFGARVGRRQMAGALLSIAGVLLVLCRGDADALLALRLVPGDFYMILATIAWSIYSWMLQQKDKDPPAVRADWAAFLMAQVLYGVLWSGLFAAGESLAGTKPIALSWPVAAALLYVAVGPAIIAFRCWGAGIERAGPNLGAFFVNLTPLFTALLSSAFLGEAPHWYHVAAFALIVGGIACSATRR